MRVLQLGPFPPPHGGVQTNLVAIRNYLRQRGDNCAVINLTRHRRRDGDEVYYPRNAWEVLRLLIKQKCDVIHLHFGGNLSLRLLGLTLVCTLLPRRTVIMTFHSGGYPSSPAGRRAGRRTLRGFIFRRLDGVIGVNQELVGLFLRLGVPANRTRLIAPHAVPPLDLCAPLPPDMDRFFERRSPRLLSVGLLEPEYDLPLQIEVLGKLQKRFPNAGLMMIGSGSLKEPIEGLIRSKPYASDILLCGDVAHETTLRAMARCDVFLRTTLYDGDSVSVREALHLGVPVIATDNGMRPEGVRLVPVSDADAVAGAVSSVVERGAARPVGGTARGAAGSENLEAVLGFYRELTQGRCASVGMI
jgi:glycosyltransferase involved in cell wall biosynthesis